MARDRSIALDRVPLTDAQLGRVVRDYVGAAGTVTRGEACWLATLPGGWSHPLVGLEPWLERKREDGPRGVEAWHLGDSVLVTTRLADDFTNAVADGLAAALARYCSAGQRFEGS